MHGKGYIGIVGGLGPYAGLDLVKKIFQLTKADRDQEDLPVMLYSFPGEVPIRTSYLLGRTSQNPGEPLGKIMVQLAQAGARIIAMPCNTAHHPRILNVALDALHTYDRSVRFINIIESSIRQIERVCRPGSHIGILATVATLETGLYQEELIKHGFTPVILNDKECATVQEAINSPFFGIKKTTPHISNESRAILLNAALRLSEKDVDAILLGCTEIPLAITEKELFGKSIIDATDALAIEVVNAFEPSKLLY